MNTFFGGGDHYLFTCNLGIYSQDWQLCLEFTTKFFYKCSFTESLTLLRDVIFDKFSAINTFFRGDQPLFNIQS